MKNINSCRNRPSVIYLFENCSLFAFSSRFEKKVVARLRLEVGARARRVEEMTPKSTRHAVKHVPDSQRFI